jgi:hypothetical protein
MVATPKHRNWWFAAGNFQAEVLSSLLFNTVNRSGLLAQERSMRSSQRQHIRRTVLSLAYFDPRHPTGRWSLDLANRGDRFVAFQLFLLEMEHVQHETGKLKDGAADTMPSTGQKGGFSQFRNVTFNNQPLAVDTKRWCFPREGLLKLDFVRLYKVNRGPVISSDSFDRSIEIVPVILSQLQLKKHSRTAGSMVFEVLECAGLLGAQLAVSQADVLVQAVRSHVQDSSAEMEMTMKAFELVMDHVRFEELTKKLSQDSQTEMHKRLGYLNSIDLVRGADALYDLDLSCKDDRACANAIVKLQRAEEFGQFFNMTYNGIPLATLDELPVDGADQGKGQKKPEKKATGKGAPVKLPSEGLFKFRYNCPEEYRNLEKRKDLFKPFLLHHLVSLQPSMWDAPH